MSRAAWRNGIVAGLLFWGFALAIGFACWKATT